MSRFVFPAWVNTFVPVVAVLVVFGGVYAGCLVAWGLSPNTLDVGYQPQQPVPFSHALHAGKLKMDCRFCHTTVDRAARAAIPATATCVKCHAGADASGAATTVSVHSQSPKLLPVRESMASGKSVLWTKVHDLPDYAYFDHSAHVTRGVSCVSCHGRVDKMDEVLQVAPLSMSWCLSCHRDPTPHLRPLDKITALDWVPEESPHVIGMKVKDQLQIESKTSCSTCHR